MAALGISIGLSVAKQIGSLLLGAHTARLQGATNENAALVQVVPAFDQDLQEINAAYLSGTADASECIAALQKVDAAIYTYIKGKVGAPGTAWSDTNGMAGKCDKTCTAGCCVYFGDLGPALSDSSVALGGPKIRGWGLGDPRLSGTTVQVPTVYGSKYGGVNRAGYTLQWPKMATPVHSTTQVQQVVNTATGRSTAQLPVTAQAASGVASQNTILGQVSSSSTLLYVIVAIVAAIAVYFGVKK